MQQADVFIWDSQGRSIQNASAANIEASFGWKYINFTNPVWLQPGNYTAAYYHPTAFFVFGAAADLWPINGTAINTIRESLARVRAPPSRR